MKRFWKSGILTCLLLGSPSAAERTWFMEPVRDHVSEVFLEQAPAARVMDTLRERFPGVELVQHTTMNGFHARGSVLELHGLRREAHVLDVIPESPVPPGRPLVEREFINLADYGVDESQAEDVRKLLLCLVPDVRIELPSGSGLMIVTGAPVALDQVRELIGCSCRDSEPRLMLEFRLMEISPQGLKRLGTSAGPTQAPDPLIETYQEFVNGLEVLSRDASPAGAFGAESR